MRDDDPMFVYYKSGWSFQIKPRNRRGWVAFGLWMFALSPVLGLFIWVMEGADLATMIIATIGLLALTGLWSIAMIVWMKARSEIIDLDAFTEERRRNDRRGPKS